MTVYGYLRELKVRRGQQVRRGEVIGESGKSGDAPRPMLHFQVRKKSAPVDPAAYLAKP
ncbi:peptidoglycan DD-metalloendopeptidase family protein [Nordella sp. HKS 07]|uniref:peptidoglycan DD-metalloendopeptidase family protein n=1 Tax=Nordella sp. HKS 07 TaxID=2712222 RepID=UPI001FEF0904|nr:M23 family metallopeptidase [Nordella sp. HKS 07]